MAESVEAGRALVCLTRLSKCYGQRVVLQDVDLELQAGHSLALLGHNGAGKTTLIKLMLGLTRPSSGVVRVAGHDPVAIGASGLRSTFGYLPENVAFHDAMSGREVLAFYARLKGVSTRACHDLLERVGLAEAAGRRVRTYSKGMRQRLGLAQALLGEPRLLFLDEPTTGLDPFLRTAFYQIVEERQAAGATVLISTHALSEIEARTERIAIMKAGRLLACGTLDELRRAAGLPVRIRVATARGQAMAFAQRLGPAATLDKINDHCVDLSCLDQQKMEVVRRIANAEETVQDMDIMPPRLDDIYAYFSRQVSAP